MGKKTVTFNTLALLALPAIQTITPDQVVGFFGFSGNAKELAMAVAGFVIALANLGLRYLTQKAHEAELAAAKAGQADAPKP